MDNLSRKPMNDEEPDGVVAGQPISYYLTEAPNVTDGAASKFFAHTAAIKAVLARLEKLVVPEHLPTASTILQEFERFRVYVSLIGQVKAGKTMLTNALVNMPGMLPSDVNPWTSVVTSIHINTPKPRGSNAVFTFYTKEDWTNLTDSGGRLGELAERAGFENELVEMRSQIIEMQRRTEERLGANFGLLLGAQHSFSGFNTSIIDRYVCLGEADSPVLGSGRYADVTKLAELYIDDSSFGFPITISDTPGVNDPFLARERATLDTLSASDICVVVLSAHQSFSTVDLALMRILMAMQAEQIVLFVNRIDELENPDQQIREIDDFIRGILRDKGITAPIPIIYGSAVWAERALHGPIIDVAQDGMDALEALASSRVRQAARKPMSGPLHLGHPPLSIEKTRDLSGLKELKALLVQKSIMNVAAPFSAEVLLRALDVANQSTLLMAQVLNGEAPIKPGLNINAVVDHLDNILRTLDLECRHAAQDISDRMLMAMSDAYEEFIETESAQIRAIVKEGRRVGDWAPDTERLRKALNAAYHAFVADGGKDIATIYAGAAAQITSVYAEVLEDRGQLFAVRAPRVLEPKTPATLMKTMTIDMKTTWIGNWLGRASGGTSFVNRFAETVTAEMNAFLTEMHDVHVLDFVNQSRRVLHDFLSDHLQTLQNLALLDGDQQGGAIRQKLGLEIEVTQRMVSLKGLTTELQALIDAVCADFNLGVQ
jgi:hypothetical protein